MYHDGCQGMVNHPNVGWTMLYHEQHITCALVVLLRFCFISSFSSHDPSYLFIFFLHTFGLHLSVFMPCQRRCHHGGHHPPW